MGDDKDSKKIKKRLKEALSLLENIASEQRALRLEVTRLSHRVSSLAPESPSEEVLAMLDDYRAQEALGARVFGAWIEVCEDDRLRGGLRTLQMREAFHATLLESRIKDLGGTAAAQVPESVEREAIERASDEDSSDAQKLAEFMERFADSEAALEPVREMAERVGGDHETRAVLETILDDERASLSFLASECARLNAAA